MAMVGRVGLMMFLDLGLVFLLICVLVFALVLAFGFGLAFGFALDALVFLVAAGFRRAGGDSFFVLKLFKDNVVFIYDATLSVDNFIIDVVSLSFMHIIL